MLWRMFRLSRRLWKLSKLHVRMVYLYFTYDQKWPKGCQAPYTYHVPTWGFGTAKVFVPVAELLQCVYCHHYITLLYMCMHRWHSWLSKNLSRFIWSKALCTFPFFNLWLCEASSFSIGTTYTVLNNGLKYETIHMEWSTLSLDVIYIIFDYICLKVPVCVHYVSMTSHDSTTHEKWVIHLFETVMSPY